MAFPYTQAVRGVLDLVVQDVPRFAHVDLDAVAVGFSQSRQRTVHGTYAKLVPLRFPGGALEGDEAGGRWRVDPLTWQGRDVLYILYVYLPRFHDQPFDERILTLFHELFHIHPSMDGSLRRFPGPNQYHGESREWYDNQLRPDLGVFLDRSSSNPGLDFLREPLDTLEKRYGGISATYIKQPAMKRVRE